MAIGHQLLKIMYHLLTRKEKYQEFGEEYYEQRQLEAKKKKAIKSLQIVLYCLNFKFIFSVAFFKNFLGTFFAFRARLRSLCQGYQKFNLPYPPRFNYVSKIGRKLYLSPLTIFLRCIILSAPFLFASSNMEIPSYMFRHTFCKWMLKATNNDIEKVRRLAGHSNIATTSRYLKDSYSDLADAVEALPKF